MKTLRQVLFILFYPLLMLKDHPILLRWKHFYVVTGGVINSLAAVAAFLVAVYYYRTRFPAETDDAAWVWRFSVVFFLSLLLSKAFHYIALGKKFFENPMKHLADTAFYNQGGQFGVLFGTMWFSWSAGINLFACMDINLLVGCLALALGRLGCYSYGCCHGRKTDSRFATVYTNPSSKALRVYPELAGVPLVPTQLVSSAFSFLLFLIMVWLLSLSPKAGLVSAFFILAYNGFRIFIERHRLSVIDPSSKKVQKRFYTNVAAVIVGIGGAYLALVLWIGTLRLSIEAPLTFSEYLSQAVLQPQTIAAAATIFLIYALLWAVHYKRLGQHFQWQQA